MQFSIGSLISFNGFEYTIQRYLGRGAVSDVYLALSQAAPGDEIILKFVRADQTDHPVHREAMRHEAEVLARLNQAEDDTSAGLKNLPARLAWAKTTLLQRHIIALLDSGEWQGLPVLAQEKAPPAFERFPVAEENDDRLRLTHEQRMLELWRTVAGVMALAHSQDLALKDFEPQTKADRVRFEPDSQNLKVIDWNITGGPEDKAQDLFYWGGHLYYGCLGHPLELDEANQPPVRLGMGVNGWSRLSEGTRQVLQQVLHRDPTRRYQRVTDLVNDLDWWLETLHRMSTTGALEKLQDRLWQARNQGRHDRALAAADLALRLEPAGEKQVAFTEWARQARQELEKADWVPLADARASLRTGAYSRAAQEFAAQINTLPREGAAARLARLYQQLALAGNQLKLDSQGADIRQTPVWEALKRGVEALVDRRWAEAQVAMAEAAPAMAGRPSFENLQNLARAGLLSEEASELNARADQLSDLAQGADWARIAQQQQDLLVQAAAKLKEAQELAPLEQDFQNQGQILQNRLKRGEALQPYYGQIEQLREKGQAALVQADYAAALSAFQDGLELITKNILAVDPAQPRARYLQHELTLARHEVEAGQALQQGHYASALALAETLLARSPDRPAAQAIQARGRQAMHLIEQAQVYLEQARQRFDRSDLDEAERIAALPLDWTRGENLPPGVATNLPFNLPSDISQALAQIHEQIQLNRQEHDRAKSAYEAENYPQVIRILTSLQQQNHPLSIEAQKWLAAAQQQEDRGRLQAEAQTNLVELAGRQWANLYRLYQTGDLNQAKSRRKELQDWHNQLVALLPGGENLPYEVGRERFTLPKELHEALVKLEADLMKIDQGCDQARLAYLNQDYQTVIEILTRLQADQLPLPAEAKGWLAEAEQDLKATAEAETLAKASLEQQARRSLDEADWQLQQGQAAETERLAEQILAWPGDFPEGFNGETRLPFWRTYTYPPELLTRARDLLERAKAHQRIEKWRPQGQYAAVKTELEKISRPLLRLEQKWQQEAEGRLTARAQARQALEPGTGAAEWERALAGLEGDPGAEAAELKQLLREQVGQQQARLHLAQAERLTQAGNWPALALAVEAGLKQDEQPLLTETEQRGGVRVRTFHLPDVVKERLAALQDRGQLGQEIEQAVEAARVTEDWTEVRKALARLGQAKPTAQEKEWGKEAQRQLDEAKRCETWARGQLDEQGKNLIETARQVLAAGRLAEARECLRQVLEVWPGQSLGERFPQAALLRAVGQQPARVSPEVETGARQVQGHIRLKELADDFPPGWMEWWDEQRTSQLVGLAEALAELAQQAGMAADAGALQQQVKLAWKKLAADAETLQQRVIGEIAQHLQQQLAQAKAGDSRTAAQLGALWAGVPVEWQKQPRLTELGRAIDTYLAAMSQLAVWQQERKRISEKFEQNPQLTFAEAWWQVGRQVWPEGLDKPDWPEGVERSEALETFFAHLEQAAQAEEEARERGGEEARGEYAAAVYQLAERWSQTEAWKQSLPLKQVERLQSDLSARMGTRLAELKTALDAALNSFRQNLDDPQVVGDLYWQVFWCQNRWSDQASLREAKQLLDNLFAELRDEAAQSFKQAIEQGQPEALAQTERWLAGLIRLKQTTANPPLEERVKRPIGLLDNFSDQCPLHPNIEAVTNWQEAVKLLQETNETESSEKVGQLLEQLKKLETTPAKLVLLAWPAGSLKKLEAEVDAYVRLITIFSQGADLTSDKAGSALQELGQTIETLEKSLDFSLSETLALSQSNPEPAQEVSRWRLPKSTWIKLKDQRQKYINDIGSYLVESITEAMQNNERMFQNKMIELLKLSPTPETWIGIVVNNAIIKAIENAPEKKRAKYGEIFERAKNVAQGDTENKDSGVMRILKKFTEWK